MLRAIALLGTLAGLWSSEQLLGPVIRGELTIDARGSEWRAMIGGHSVPVRRGEGRVEFELPNGAGEFRGRIAGDRISGHWIQPRTAFPYLSRYTTPVELTLARPNIWRGEVVPLDQRVSFYLMVDGDVDGDRAYLRNPEGNVFGRNQYTAELKDGTVTLARLNHPQRLSGAYDEETERFSLPLLYNSAPISFKRRDELPLGFLPRVPPAWSYRAPIAENDGWATASLSDVGLDLQPIAALVQKILTASPSEHALNIHSVLIARHGKLVFEEYFYGFDRNRPHDMRSASKTYAPLLVGIAKVDPATPVSSILAGFKASDKVTVRDLMTMTSGLDCDDGDDQSRGNEDAMQNQDAEPDWYRYTMALPMKRESGGDRAIYCSAGINLLGAIVKERTGKWIPELFHDAVAKPLQMRRYHLNLMPTGDAYLGGGMYIRPRDQLKLGQLYLNGGTWNGRRVVSSAWVRDSLTRHAAFAPTATDSDHGYGYAWHTHDLSANGTTVRDWYAGGNGGQLIVILPSLDMVIGITGGNYGESRKFFKWETELVPQHLIPAAAPPRTPPR